MCPKLGVSAEKRTHCFVTYHCVQCVFQIFSFFCSLDSINMSSTSQKHRNFVQEPMGGKTVSALAGIGYVLGGRLTDRGFNKVNIKIEHFGVAPGSLPIYTCIVREMGMKIVEGRKNM